MMPFFKFISIVGILAIAKQVNCRQEFRQDALNEIYFDKDVLEALRAETDRSGLEMIFPGTKWCGAGDIAENDNDFGPNEDEDRCCQAHDKCNDLLLPGESKYGLTNTSPFTKLSCECDQVFYNCLTNVSSYTSDTIGYLYFNSLERECYKLDYPDSSTCKRYETTFFLRKCVEYEKDTTAPKVYQWVPAKKFETSKLPDFVAMAHALG